MPAEHGPATLRPSFYALASGSWRDYVTLLHAPYTAWHLSYVVLGAALAPTFDAGRLGLALAAFFLAVGVAAHALDELHGRPLGTLVPAAVLRALAGTSLAGALAIGVLGSLTVPWLAAFVVAGITLVLAYNLELLGGRMHTDAWFALSWGAFPVLATGFACAGGRLTLPICIGAAFATVLSLAQRRLSTQVRHARRRVVRVEGTLETGEGHTRALTLQELTGPGEDALRALALASVLASCALVAVRVA